MTSARTYDRTILGPLTTAWSQPDSCSVAIRKCDTCTDAWLGQICASDTTVFDDKSCYPPRASGVKEISQPLGDWGFYSPGVSCPVGYASACGQTAGDSGGDWSFMFSMSESETAMGCCPTGFTCHRGGKDLWQTCMQIATTGTFPTATCEDGATNSYNVLTVPAPDLDVYTRVAPMFQLNFKASDISSTVSRTGGTGPTHTGKPSSNKNEESGLGQGAKIGIGVGVALGVVLLLVAAFFIWRHRKAKMAARGQVQTTEYKPQSWANNGQEEGQVHELGYERVRHELPGA